jgi:hypothetical protein
VSGPGSPSSLRGFNSIVVDHFKRLADGVPAFDGHSNKTFNMVVKMQMVIGEIKQKRPTVFSRVLSQHARTAVWMVCS